MDVDPTMSFSFNSRASLTNLSDALKTLLFWERFWRDGLKSWRFVVSGAKASLFKDRFNWVLIFD